MWLLDCTQLHPQRSYTGNIQLKYFPHKTPPYAILSHTWLDDNTQEISFQDMMRGPDTSKLGYEKVLNCCLQARRDKIDYCWIDTCCINKQSSAELSEAINSMFMWYKQAQVCYAYLPSVDKYSPDLAFQFATSRWFTRGWTLQELLAPSHIIFFGKSWGMVGNKASMSREIKRITGIECRYLLRENYIQEASIAKRMSWAANRETTRKEDIAYCLLGIFGINMSLLYGEQEKAFQRLQEEIIKEYDDQSLFAWESRSDRVLGFGGSQGILAKSPKDFELSANIRPLEERLRGKSFMITNRGLKIRMPFIQSERGQHVGLLGCAAADDGKEAEVIGLGFTSTMGTLNRHEQLKRIGNSSLLKVPWSSIDHDSLTWATVFIAKTMQPRRLTLANNTLGGSKELGLDDYQISGECSIECIFPDFDGLREYASQKRVTLLRPSEFSDLVVMCIKQPSGNRLCLVVGFPDGVDATEGAKMYWFDKYPHSLESAEIEKALQQTRRMGTSHQDDLKARLEVIWYMYKHNPKPWKTSPNGFTWTEDGYIIDIQVQQGLGSDDRNVKIVCTDDSNYTSEQPPILFRPHTSSSSFTIAELAPKTRTQSENTLYPAHGESDGEEQS